MEINLQVPTIGKINPIPCEDCQDGLYRNTDGKVVECDRMKLPPVDENACHKKRSQWLETLKKAGIERRYIDAHLSNLDSIYNVYQQQQVREYCASIQSNIENGIGIILRGPVGTGKTTLGIAVLQHALLNGYGALFVPTASLLDNIFTLKATNIEDWASYEKRLRTASLLMLDDLGTETDKTDGWVITKLDAIISERYNRMLPVIITTNLTSEQMKGKYAERIIDRLKQTSLVLNFKGKSLREAKK